MPVSMDALLADAITKMDALGKRMDAMELGEGKKDPIAKGDDDDDKASKDDDAKSKADDDDDKKSDATEPKDKILADDDDDKKKDDTSTVTPPPMKSDKKRADAKKSDDGELEIKHEPDKKGDAKKADAAKAKADDDDDKKDDAVAKADAIGDLKSQLASQSAIIAKLQAMMKPKSDDEHAAFADAQSRADAVYQGFGKHAPRSLEGEELIDYRKRLARDLKQHSSKWSKTKFAKLDEDTFGQIEEQVYADATHAAANPVDLEAGELRMVTKVDPVTGGRFHLFYGKESFVKQMGRPGRRVTGFRTMSSQ